jgi:hypothetical protein
MHIMARQPIGSGPEEAVKAAVVDRIPERIQAWTIQTGPTVAIIAKHLRGLERFTLGSQVSPQASHLLVNRLGLALALCRDADIDAGFLGSLPRALRRPGC